MENNSYGRRCVVGHERGKSPFRDDILIQEWLDRHYYTELLQLHELRP